jgi:hypothetical protein
MAVAWTLVIMVLCWLPGPMVRDLEGDSAWFKIPNLDKVVHAGIFIGFSILWARLGTSRRRLVWIAVGGFGLAVLTEVVQKLAVVGRDGRVDDAILDVAGILVGIVAIPFVEPVFRLIESRFFGETASRSDEGAAPVVSVEEVSDALN